MKQITLLVLALSLVGMMAFGVVSDASAEEITPFNPGNGGRGNGRGGNGTGTGVPIEMNINLDGILDEAMSAYIADGLGISVEDLKAREAAGETLVGIGISLGFDAQTVLDLHEEARFAALEQAVADGLLTAEQADWMISRLDNGQYGIADGTCTGTGDCTGISQQSPQQNMRRQRFSNPQ